MSFRSSPADFWNLHPHGDYFIQRGGDKIMPPRHANLTLTNKCNLRCTICGNQSFLHTTKTPRSHMDFALFQNISETIFPFLREVELNSRGEPLLYPHIDEVFEALRKHECAFCVQHNGTLLTDKNVENICTGYGTVSLSIDAVSPLFDQVRCHGQWEKVEIGLKNLVKKRNPEQIFLSFYPTVTHRTSKEMLPIVTWAHEHGIDAVIFHDYTPIGHGIETVPDPEIKKQQIGQIADFLQKENSTLRVLYDADCIHAGAVPKRAPHPSRLKGSKEYRLGINYPLDSSHPGAHKTQLCPAVYQSIDIGVHGHITPCCRTQIFPFGRVDSLESFADVWLGEQYKSLRRLLSRTDNAMRLPLPFCEPCIASYAKETSQRVSTIPYTNNLSTDPDSLTWDNNQIIPLVFFRVEPNSPAFRAFLPLGLDARQYDVYEDDLRLGPFTTDAQKVIAEGNGLYTFGNGFKHLYAGADNEILISASDNSDIPVNGHHYTLRRRSD